MALVRDDAVPVRKHMSIALIAPVVVLVALGVLLAWQVSRMREAADAVNASDDLIATMFRGRARMIEKESSLRAWLLSGDRELLGPFEQIHPELALEEADTLTVNDPSQHARVAEIRSLLARWITLAQRATDQPVEVARRDTDALRTRNGLLDRARELLREGVSEATTQLDRRTQDDAAIERTVMISFVGLVGLSALLIGFVSRRQLGTVVGAFQHVVGNEREARAAAADQAWVRRGEADVGTAVVGERTVAEVASAALDVLCAHTGAVVGAIYQLRGDQLHRIAGHGLAPDVPATLPAAAGQLGQALADRRPRRVADADVQLAIAGGVGAARTVELAIAPAVIDDRAIGVVELGFAAGGLPHGMSELLGGVATTIGLALRGAEQRMQLQELLEETQRQGEELQAQHEELRVTNEELEQQSAALRDAHARQQQIQHELEAANASLEEQTAILEQQREELLRSQKDLELHARELQRASQYKSDFLARMSHELRTPLNSSLILARLLADNPHGNLDEEQVRFANTIYAAGNDLLVLINDILDLAKIEAGRLELRPGPVAVGRLRDSLVREFEPVAASRGLRFAVEVAPGTPEQLVTDDQRLVQVLRNLLSNACKFTERGEVVLAIEPAGDHVRFRVRDTGIGIPEEQRERVFEVFHQVDGSSGRRHGGTGLGLAISRDLAALLGGTLGVDSELGRGSVFTLDIPQRLTTDAGAAPMAAPPPPPPRRVRPRPASPPEVAAPTPAAGAIADDRAHLDPERRTLLVVEDDPAFASVLRDLVHERGHQVVVATTADEGIALARRHHPDGVLLDVKLPDHSGLSVLERLKRLPALRHVPVHMMSVEDHTQRSLELGAVGYVLKPAGRDALIRALQRIEDRTERRVRRLLIVEDDPRQVEALRGLLGGNAVEITSTGTIAGALDHLATTTFDCVVLDLWLGDGTGFELLERMTADDRITFPPVIVHTGKPLTDDEEAKLRHYSSSIIVKGARSPERLLDEVTLFLHQIEAEMPPDRQRILREVRDREAVFEGKTVLIAEDDVRNVFALTSLLEPRGLRCVIARNGREAIDALAGQGIDLVLMDVMMPELDGLAATREIRGAGNDVPIIALTAKAMVDDRQACLDAGANDYLAKPINLDMLLSLLRVWLPR